MAAAVYSVCKYEKINPYMQKPELWKLSALLNASVFLQNGLDSVERFRLKSIYTLL